MKTAVNNSEALKLQSKRVAVVGAGRSGRAAAQLLRKQGAYVRIVDRNPTASADMELRNLADEILASEHCPEQFQGVDMVVMSPGAPLAVIAPHLPQGWEENLPVWSEMELASRFVHEPIIALTGSNGKTTTVTLMAHMLEQAGKNVFLGGNIGTPLSSYVLQDKKADVLVLEVSSFQLQTCRTFRPHIGVLLNFSPNHLDYHASLEEYLEAKLQLFANQQVEDIALFPKSMQEEAKQKPGLGKTTFFEPTQDFSPGRLLGCHNRANMQAAWQVAAHMGVNREQAQYAIETFKPLPHRLEPVAEKNGVLFVNDSKATTVDSLRAALECFDRPILLLAGGVFKGGDLKLLRPLIQEKVKEICLFGQSESIFREAWHGQNVPVHFAESLDKALATLLQKAEQGDVVLLSPATSSFDQYINYVARGEHFRRLVEALA